jgi:uncharacterized membrane protein
MAAFGVPPPYRESLTTLAGLTDDDADQLVAEIGGLAAFSPVSMIQAATAKVLGEDAGPAVRQLAFPLLALRGQLRKMTAGEVAKRLSESTDLELGQQARAQLRRRAAAILETDVLKTTAVATDLQTQNPRNFQSAKIVTDIRPVFGDEVNVRPLGAVIVETLQIQTWTRDGNSELIFVSMDEKDLTQLREIVDRALVKTKTLSTLLSGQNLPYFELEKEDG